MQPTEPLCTPEQYAAGIVIAFIVLCALCAFATWMDSRRKP